jgi:hypothetical protein
MPHLTLESPNYFSCFWASKAKSGKDFFINSFSQLLQFAIRIAQVPLLWNGMALQQLKKSERQACRRPKADSSWQKQALERGPEGPYYPNVAFFSSLFTP